MYIYGKNVAREKINSEDKIRRAFISDNFKDKDICAPKTPVPTRLRC